MRKLITCIVLVVILVGCSSKNTGGASTQENTYQGTPFPSVVSTPIAGKATVFGKLTSPSGQSLTGLTLYFGTILPLTPGPDHLVNVDTVSSPRTVIFPDGRFIAENIPPGEYVLIIWTPHESRYIPDPNNPDLEFTVKAEDGKIVDIGTLEAPALP